MNRRDFLSAAALAALPGKATGPGKVTVFRGATVFGGASAAFTAASAAGPRRRAAILAHTGRGNYGHGLDSVWKIFDAVELVAIADPDRAGREKAQARLGVAKGYADYREMLAREKPELVSVCPRHLDQRAAMILAAAQAGCHIYTEKPFAPNLEAADRMVAAVRSAGVKLQIAHQMRCSPFLLRAVEMVRNGEIGDLQEIRGRGKEDHRVGGEDMMVLGSHICDVMRIFLGDPRWVFAHVQQDGEELAAKHVRSPTEPLGPVAGRQIAAMFAFDNGVHAYFASKQTAHTHALRFGTYIYGSQGVIFVPNAIYPDGQPWILRSAAWVPEGGAKWEPIPVEPKIPFQAQGYDIANGLMVLDLFDAIEKDRKPVCSEIDGRWTIEMIAGIYRSQIEGKPVEFPLADRRWPLVSLAG
jgi:predicted dehydrogenase